MQNPFKYGKVVEQPFFTDRDDILQSMVIDVEAGNNLVLYSPRRYGKTSLLIKLAKEIQKKGFYWVYLDFYKVTSQYSFIELYSKEIITQINRPLTSLVKKLGSLLRGVIPNLSFDSSGNPTFSLSFIPQGDIPQTLSDTLNLPERLVNGKRWLIIFDEFQEIMTLNGESFANQLRATIQFHQKCVYIFSGSKRHLLLNLFNMPNQSLYRFCKTLTLKKIDHDVMISFLIERFASTGIQINQKIAEKIISETDNIPNYVQYLASEIWQLCILEQKTPEESVISIAVEKMISNLQDYFFNLWENLNLYQKKVLKALVHHKVSPFSREFQETNHLGSISGTQRAIQKLVEMEIINREDNEYVISDPFFKKYIEQRII